MLLLHRQVRPGWLSPMLRLAGYAAAHNHPVPKVGVEPGFCLSG